MCATRLGFRDPNIKILCCCHSVSAPVPDSVNGGGEGPTTIIGTGALLLSWGQGLGWSWTPTPRCTAPNHCCCCDTAPTTVDVSHNHCCGCDSGHHAAPTALPESHCCTCDTTHALSHAHAHTLYDTCNGFDDVDYSMDCSGDFGF